MTKSLFLTGVVVLMLAAPSYAQFTSVIAGGPHDLSNGSAVRNTNATINGQTCVFCHVPHSGSTSQPLWNRAPTTAAFQVYTSSTSASVATSAAIGAGISGACLSCHDGTIAMDVVTNINGLPFGVGPKGGLVAFTAGPQKKATYGNGTGVGTANVMNGGLPFLGTDLRNDHPVAISYQTAVNSDSLHYTPITQVGAKIYIDGSGGQLPLFGTTTANATVECASCHDSHNNSLNGTNGGFLRQANTGSQMCKGCHLK